MKGGSAGTTFRVRHPAGKGREVEAMGVRKTSSARHFALLVTIVAVITAMAVPAVGQSDGLAVPTDQVESIKADKGPANYIVWMVGDPVVAYEGGIRGLAATKPRGNEKINPNSAKVLKYQEYLTAQADELLVGVGASPAQKMYQYSVVFTGFAAELTAQQAAALSVDANVLGVFEDEIAQLDTATTPDFLGLTDEGGFWSEYQGEDVIIGIIDSGVWPENPAFSDRTGTSPKGKDGKLGYQQIPGWHGKCTPGEDFDASDCNQKLIGAQYFAEGFGGGEAIKAEFPLEFISPRDADGHGTHTASTAGGNQGVAAVLESGLDLGVISGIAPRARIAAYKVCWGYLGAGGCPISDNVAAIDQAVADGVDVINYSISGTQTNFLDPVEVAFLFAADAGVVVNASAGNSGPGAATVAHPSPWITTVAAGTHDRFYAGEVTLGDDSTYSGASLGGTAEGDLVYSADVGLADADPTEVALCYPGTLDSALVNGKIVACDRGAIARVDKSLAVLQAGGIGMIHLNVSPSSINADLHSVPTVHVDHIDGAVIRAYAQTDGATAVLTGGTLETVEAPFVAAFSSRGPLQASGDLLKPDIMGPGVDVLAGYSPQTGNAFDFLSGTSMSSPHLAGLSALMKDAHPDWSPAMIKSALMTTATQLTNQGADIPGGPFAYGSGQAVPNSALDPGLVYDAGFIDYLGFLCGTGQLQASYCPVIGIDPSDLNQPNIAIGELAGSQTVTRTVTNVGPEATYEVSVDAPVGVDVTVEPEELTLGSGESASYSVTFTTNESAAIGSYAFGSLTWSDAHHNVTSQLVIRPVQLAAPDEVSGSGTDGTLSYDVSFGYGGEFTAAAHGLVPATTVEGNVVDDPANDINTALATGVGVTFEFVTVPAGTAFSRISLFDEYTDGSDDLDLYVFGPATAGFPFVGGSGSGTSAEQVDLPFPAAGLYIVAVHGWQTDGPDANYTLFDWSVSAIPGGSLEIDAAPASATLGATGTIDLSWTELAADTKYLGAVSYADAGGLFGLTLVAVSTE